MSNLLSIFFLRNMTSFQPTNGSADDVIGDSVGRSDVQIGFEVFLAILISLTAFIGNSLVVYAIHRDARLNTITNLLIENLAFSDILMALLHMPFWIVSLRYGRWVFGHAVCQIAGVTQLIFGIVSLLTMTAIAINRYFKVVKRHLYVKFFSSRKTTYLVIALCWFASIAVNTPQLYGWGKIDYHVIYTDCTCVWGLEDKSYILFLCIATIFLPATIIFSCYFVIYRTVRESARRVQGHSALPNPTKTDDKTENKVLKTSLVVVVVYMVCWTPLSVIGFKEVFGSTSARWLHFVSYTLAYCSSMTNPFIYGIMNPQFKNAFASILHLRDSTASDARVSVSRNVVNSHVDIEGMYSTTAPEVAHRVTAEQMHVEKH